MGKDKWTAEMVQEMIVDPRYFLFGLIPQGLWIEANKAMIKQMGAGPWLEKVVTVLEESGPTTKGPEATP